MEHEKSHEELLEDLIKIEEKLISLLNYYIEKGIIFDLLRRLLEKYSILSTSTDRRRYSSIGYAEKSRRYSELSSLTEKQAFSLGSSRRRYSSISKYEKPKRPSIITRLETISSKNLGKKQVIFDIDKDDDPQNQVSHTLSRSLNPKTSSRIQDVVENINILHNEVSSKLNEIHTIEERKKTFIEPEMHIEWDEKLRILQLEKDELEERILQYVIQNIVEGKDELLNIISSLENENNNLIDLIDESAKKINFLQEMNMAIILENARLRRNEPDLDLETFREEIRHSLACIEIFPLFDRSFFKNLVDSDEPDYDLEEKRSSLSLSPSLDSFDLDAQLAQWNLDEQSMQEKVRRLGKDLEIMEVTHMKMNLLKRYVRKNGSKFINRGTLIDPTKDMSLWHAK